MQTIATLKEGDWVEEIYLVTSKQISTAKNGVTFLSLKLADKKTKLTLRREDGIVEEHFIISLKDPGRSLRVKA